MTRPGYPLKHIRLQQLEEAGLNIADYVCFPRGQLDTSQLKEFCEKHIKVSCRHFHENEDRHFKGPFEMGVETEKAVQFCITHNSEWWTLCNEFLPKETTGFSGNILLIDDRNYTVEYFEGCDSPRMIESKSAKELKMFSREFGKPLPKDAPIELVETAVNCGRFLRYIRPIILEFNIYPYPVGRHKLHSIFWEWRIG